MTEPSDEQIIADAMLLGLEFERYESPVAGKPPKYRCITPIGERTMLHKTQAFAARWGLHYIGWHYRGGTLTRK
jgi:hypothetical protein